MKNKKSENLIKIFIILIALIAVGFVAWFTFSNKNSLPDMLVREENVDTEFVYSVFEKESFGKLEMFETEAFDGIEIGKKNPFNK
jgi:hypothetical protein